MMKVAALFSWILGLGFGLPCLYGIRYFAEHGRVWTFLGFPTYGEGLFEKAGVPTSVPLLASFLLVGVAEMILGWMLWSNQRAGPLFSLVLLPIEFVFWAGFLLPFGPPFGVARTALALLTAPGGSLRRTG